MRDDFLLYASHSGYTKSTQADSFENNWGAYDPLPDTPAPDFANLLEVCEATATPANVNAPVPALPAEAVPLVSADAFDSLGYNLNYDFLAQPTQQQHWTSQLDQPVQDWQYQQEPLLPPIDGTEYANPAPAPAYSCEAWNQLTTLDNPHTLGEPQTLGEALQTYTLADLDDVTKFLDSLPVAPVAPATAPSRPTSPSPMKTKSKGKGKGKARLRSPVAEKLPSAPEPKKRARRVAARRASAAIAAAVEDVDMFDAAVDLPSHIAPDAAGPSTAATSGRRRKPAKAKGKGHQRARSSVSLSLSDVKMAPAKPRRNQTQKAVYYPPQKLTSSAELLARRVANTLPSIVNGEVETLYTDDSRSPYGKDIGVRRVCGECNKLLPYPKPKPKGKGKGKAKVVESEDDDESESGTEEEEEEEEEESSEPSEPEDPNEPKQETVRLGLMPGTTVMLHCNACGIYQRDKVERRAMGMWKIEGHSYPDGDAEFPPVPRDEHVRMANERAEGKRIRRKWRETKKKLKKQRKQLKAAKAAVLGNDEEEDEEEPEYDDEDFEVFDFDE